MSKEDPLKVHREGTILYDSGNYGEAAEKFLQASELYGKVGNCFDASYTMYKAGECSYFLKNYETAAECFLKAAELALEKGFDRFAVSALEYARNSYKAAENEEEAENLRKQIAELKNKLSKTF